MTPYDYGQSVVLTAAGLEKTGAGFFARAGEAAASGARRMGQSFQSLAGMPKSIGNRMGAGRAARELEGQAGAAVPGQQLDLFKTPLADPKALQQRASQGRQWANKELTHQAWQAAPAAATLGIGIAGTGYAASPADTYRNRASRASNRHLGTNFGQQSRAGAFFGS